MSKGFHKGIQNRYCRILCHHLHGITTLLIIHISITLLYVLYMCSPIIYFQNQYAVDKAILLVNGGICLDPHIGPFLSNKYQTIVLLAMYEKCLGWSAESMVNKTWSSEKPNCFSSPWNKLVVDCPQTVLETRICKKQFPHFMVFHLPGLVLVTGATQNIRNNYLKYR